MGRPKSFDEDVVLDRAVQLFRERGYEGTSMADLEGHLQLGRQSLYNTFGDKRDLYLKALERYQQQAADTTLAVLEAPDAGLDAVRSWLGAYAVMLAAPGHRAGCLVVNSIVERPGDPPTAARCSGGRQRMLRAVRTALARAQARGELPANRDLDGLSQLLVAHVYGLAVLARAGTAAAALRSASKELMAMVR
jgi:TetR/AcrR family transcriptional repressor of nem operon